MGGRRCHLPSDHHLPFLLAPMVRCCSMGLSSRNPHLLWQGELPISSSISHNTPTSFWLHRFRTHQGLTPAHIAHTRPLPNHCSPRTPTCPSTHAQTRRYSPLPGPSHLGRPRTAHFALGQPNFLTCHTLAWNCTCTQVPQELLLKGTHRGFPPPPLHGLVHAPCCVT